MSMLSYQDPAKEVSTISVHPQHVLALLVAILVLLGGLAFFFPIQGIHIWSISLNFPSTDRILGTQPLDPDYITLDCSSNLDNPSFVPDPMEQAGLPAYCSEEDIRKLKPQRIEYPDGDKGALYDFLRELHVAPKQPAPIRVLHYGDSQLEADRISLYIRSQLQHEFGGTGVGYFALNPAIPINPTIKLTLSSNWQHSTPMVKVKSGGAALKVGHLLAYSKASLKDHKSAWIKIEQRTLRTYPPLQFNRLNMVVRNQDMPAPILIKTPTKTLYSGRVLSSPEVQYISCDASVGNESITIVFGGEGTVEVYAVGLDGNTGISVDNIPLRSSSGIDFVKADTQVLAESYELLNAKLIIMQFGANMVPSRLASYKKYEEDLYTQLKLIRTLAPKASVLVVGVSDMARRNPQSGAISSYPNVELVRDAQKSAAFRAGCAFWDTYKAMGGRNSIVSWANARPPLAAKDFCHFSQEGATLVSELLYASLALELKDYKVLAKEADTVSPQKDVWVSSAR